MLLSEHHQEIELDLIAQNLDVLDFWRGSMSPRRLLLILKALPPDSHLVRALNPEAAVYASWRTGDYMTAHLIDMYARINFVDPKPFPRPADQVATARRHEALERQGERIRSQLTS